jgi:hypothetical protein
MAIQLDLNSLKSGLYGERVNQLIDTVLTTLPSGSVGSAISQNIYGFNHMQTPSAIQSNKDYYGYTFFTRPDLNLAPSNLMSHRWMNPLLSKDKMSLQRMIRCTLDPELGSPAARGEKAGIDSPFVDPHQAFIPILSNTLLSISGWPDFTVPTYTSPAGVYKEATSWVDGMPDIYGVYDVTLNFRNIPGNPVIQLFYYWILYECLVYMGNLVPNPDNNLNNRIDYNTRIYRLTMDETKRYVTGIYASGASFPTSVPLGALANYEADRGPINNANDQISIPMRCIGFQAMDDVLIDDFNRTSYQFNSVFAKKTASGSDVTRSGFHKLTADEKRYWNFFGYPQINENTLELEWWVENDIYTGPGPTKITSANQDASLRTTQTTQTA